MYKRQVHVVDINGASDLVLKKDRDLFWPSEAEFVTKGNWYFTCLPYRAGHGNGFLGHAPDGTTYEFDHFIRREHKSMSLLAHGPQAYRRDMGILVARRVIDKFGNWVRFNYSGTRLSSITSNDGRHIALQYSCLLYTSPSPRD